MNITDIFNNRSPKKLNEAIETVFGKKLDLEAFTIEQLEDSRNRLRTQIYAVRSSSGFNETVENDSYTKAQWMLDAINAEVMQRDSQMVEEAAMFYAMHTNVRTGEPDPYQGPFASEQEAQAWIDSETPNPEEYSVDGQAGDLGQLDHGKPVNAMNPAVGMAEGAMDEMHADIVDTLEKFDEKMNEIGGYGDPDYEKIIAALSKGDIESALDEMWESYSDQDGGELRNKDSYFEDLKAEFEHIVQGGFDPLKHIDNPTQGVRDAAPDVDRSDYGARAALMKAGGVKDDRGPRGVTQGESIEQNINNGEDMTQVRESATDKASAVVTAKTMVDRVGRWIEELAGMENDTLLSLGDTIRDEMGQDQAKAFLSNVAPAIQQALQNLKATRETLATGVRGLTGEEQSAELIGSEAPDMGGDMGAGDEIAPVAPDEMNTGEEAPADEFGASEPAVGGMETAGRAQRESIDRSSQLLRVLAG
jgi:hypothetical protein